MLTVYILASRRDARYAQEFWTHLAPSRRQMDGVTWVQPLYVEDMREATALVPSMPEGYIVIGCLSNWFMAALLEQPALKEMVLGARVKVPFVFSHCQWDDALSPFAGKRAAANEVLASSTQKDRVFVEAVQALRRMLTDLV